METFSSHCFRHTFATRCIENNIEPKVVQEELGHATLQMTMDLYVKPCKKYKKEEMKKLENTLDMSFVLNEKLIKEKYTMGYKNAETFDV